MIKLLKIEFDARENLRSATFDIDESVLALIRRSLDRFVPAYREFGILMIDLDATQMRWIAADLGDRRSPTSEVSETYSRLSRVIEAFEEN
jgi:hypothetical protein